MVLDLVNTYWHKLISSRYQCFLVVQVGETAALHSSPIWTQYCTTRHHKNNQTFGTSSVQPRSRGTNVSQHMTDPSHGSVSVWDTQGPNSGSSTGLARDGVGFLDQHSLSVQSQSPQSVVQGVLCSGCSEYLPSPVGEPSRVSQFHGGSASDGPDLSLLSLLHGQLSLPNMGQRLVGSLPSLPLSTALVVAGTTPSSPTDSMDFTLSCFHCQDRHL